MKKITQEELSRILQQHKLWIETNGVTGQCAELQDANLRYTNLRGAGLQDADLRGANLQGANLYDANLRSADLQDANLQGANLQGADLRYVDLWNADLRHARFNTNILDCSSFSGAQFTSDALPWLILHPEWSELKDTVEIEAVEVR